MSDTSFSIQDQFTTKNQKKTQDTEKQKLIALYEKACKESPNFMKLVKDPRTF